MYNLIVLPKTYMWTKECADLMQERFLEHTDDSIKETFESLGEKEIALLCSYPTVFASEMGQAFVGTISQIIVRRGKIRFFYERNTNYSSFSLADFIAEDMDFDTDEYQRSRTHWAVKDSDLFEGLSRTGLGTKPAESTEPTETVHEALVSEPPDLDEAIPTHSAGGLWSKFRDPAWATVLTFVGVVVAIIALAL